MKFKSSFGLVEIVSTAPYKRFRGDWFKISTISFTMDGSPVELIGDPDFDQERGYSPGEPEEREPVDFDMDEG